MTEETTSLMDSIAREEGEEEQAEEQPATTEEVNDKPEHIIEENEWDEAGDEPSWYIKSDLPGDGEPPEGFKSEKFKTVEEQLKAYNNLEKKLGAHTGAPGEYDVKLEEDLQDLDVEQHQDTLEGFKEFAREQGINNDAFNKVVNQFIRNNKKQFEQEKEAYKTFQQEEMKKIGDNPKEELNKLQNWFIQNFSEDELPAFKNMVVDANSFHLAKKMAEKMSGTNIPTQPTGNNQDPMPSDEELREMANDPRRFIDREYDKKIKDLYKRKYSKD